MILFDGTKRIQVQSTFAAGLISPGADVIQGRATSKATPAGPNRSDYAWLSGFNLGYADVSALPPASYTTSERAAWFIGYESGKLTAAMELEDRTCQDAGHAAWYDSISGGGSGDFYQ
jgi:hypothetical protein